MLLIILNSKKNQFLRDTQFKENLTDQVSLKTSQVKSFFVKNVKLISGEQTKKI